MARRRRKRNSSKKWVSAEHRKPPMPDWFISALWGCCRWCNQPILKDDGQINKRRRWHPDCLHDYLIITDHRYAKRQVKKRDKAICADCGLKCRYRNEWEVDHVIALADIPRKDLKYWRLENLSTKCVACHLKKTIQENVHRRKEKAKRRKMVKRKRAKRDS